MNVTFSARVCVPVPLGCNAKTVRGDAYFNAACVLISLQVARQWIGIQSL